MGRTCSVLVWYVSVCACVSVSRLKRELGRGLCCGRADVEVTKLDWNDALQAGPPLPLSSYAQSGGTVPPCRGQIDREPGVEALAVEPHRLQDQGQDRHPDLIVAAGLLRPYSCACACECRFEGARACLPARANKFSREQDGGKGFGV